MAKQTRSPVPLPTMEQVDRERQRIRRRKAYFQSLTSTVGVLAVVAALAVLISSLFLPVMQISGDSMEPTLKDGEIIVLVKTEHFETGDLCSFSWNNKTLIKRVIAGPGDWVEIDSDGTVYVNQAALNEPYITEKSLGECDLDFPYQVPDNHYFALGDHRTTSIDSRSTVIGSVNKDQIIGKVMFRIWPLNAMGLIS
jgi:signal peptidase I